MTQVKTQVGPRSARVLGEFQKGGVLWLARVGSDRGRLEVVAIVPPAVEPQVIPLLTDGELRAPLGGGADSDAGWRCAECAAENASDRRWCECCSSHATA